VPTPAPSESPLASNAWYVSTTGSDTAAGTGAAPWRTVQKAVNTVAAGSTVYVRAGTYSGFVMSRSGTAGAPIVIAGYPGDARPVITNTGTAVDTIRLNGVHDVTLTGLVIEGARGVGDQGAGIRTENAATRIVIRDNLIRNNNAYGIYSHRSTSVTIEGNELTGNEAGVIVAYEAAGTRITGNQIHDNNRMIVNTVSPTNDDHGAVGVVFLKTAGPVVASGNTLWGNRAASHDYEWDGGAFETYGASNVTITDNRMWDNENVFESGTDSSYACSNLRFTRNVAWGAASQGRSFGMFLRCASSSYVASNTFYGLDGFVFAVGTSSAYSGSIDNLQIVNNVAVMASGKIIGIDTAIPASVVIDYNDAWSSAGGVIASVTGKGSTSSLATFQAWTGLMAHGASVDPRFVSGAGRDFRLQGTSPAIDKGVVIGGEPYSGAAPDLGRYEVTN
jgi:parallel beta-helix repeat protein